MGTGSDPSLRCPGNAECRMDPATKLPTPLRTHAAASRTVRLGRRVGGRSS